MSLQALKALVIDCQSTGANPEQGSLLELGWRRLDRGETVSLLIRLPKGAAIPAAVARITGIGEEEMREAVPARKAWASLLAHAGKAPFPVVIHYARFEEPFLLDLHRRFGGESAFPLDILCTHEISRRLLPDLPRRGLRALAGYLGYPAPQLRRAAEHAGATAYVWEHLTGLLAERGITALPQLKAWLAAPPPRKSKSRAYLMSRDARLNLPDGPGVYRMFRKNGDLLYIGKATSLKKRVNSYFQKFRKVPERTLELVTQAAEIKVAETATAVEAALLESDEIKRHAPPYNVALQDSGRGLWFASRDWKKSSEKPSASHPLGPFRHRETIDSILRLDKLLQAKRPRFDADAARVIFGTPPDQAPEPACFKEGFRLFREGLHPFRLPFLGARLWKEWKARIEAEKLRLDEEEDAVEEEEWTWDPETVDRALRSVLRHGAHSLRRARWQLRLCESVIAWKEPGRKQRRVLCVRGGRIASARDLGLKEPLPEPEGSAETRLARQRSLDPAALDRLTILTQHLRSVFGAGREAVLVLGGGRCFCGEALRRALWWV